jgi:hypothetical protein
LGLNIVEVMGRGVVLELPLSLLEDSREGGFVLLSFAGLAALCGRWQERGLLEVESPAGLDGRCGWQASAVHCRLGLVGRWSGDGGVSFLTDIVGSSGVLDGWVLLALPSSPLDKESVWW